MNKLIEINSNELVNKHRCPLCCSRSRRLICNLPKLVQSNSFEIVYETTISVFKCEKCSLQYKDPIPVKNVDLKVYQNYALKKKLRWARKYPNDLLQHFDFQVTDKILEVGPGETPVCTVSKMGDHYRMDIDESHLDTFGVVSENNKARLILGSIDQPVSEDYFEHFDYILLFDVIEHVEDVDQVFKNLIRLLKPGGKVLIETGNSLSRSANEQNKYWKYYSIPEHRVFFTKKAVVYLSQKYGFQIEVLNFVRHKGVRTYVGFLRKTLAWIKWSVIARKEGNTELAADQLNLTPDLPWDRDHLFCKLKKVK